MATPAAYRPPAYRPIVRTAYVQPAPVRTGGAWEVQVGAFGRPEEARLATAMAQHATPVLAASRTLVTTTGGLGGQLLYRARLAGLDHGGASSACDALRGQSIPCMLVPPGG